MENSPEFDRGDDTSEVLNEPDPAPETIPGQLDDDPEVSSRIPPDYIIAPAVTKQEAHVRRPKVEKAGNIGGKDSKDDKEVRRGGSGRPRVENLNSNTVVLVSVAVVAVVGAIIAKLACARKLSRA